MFCIVCKLSDSTRENRAKARIGDIFDLDGPIMDGTHYPRYLQGQKGFVLTCSVKIDETKHSTISRIF